MGTEFVGDHLSEGIDFMGIVCPGGQEVGDWKSGDQMGSGPNASKSILVLLMVRNVLPIQFISTFYA